MNEIEWRIDRLKTAVRTFQEAGIRSVLIGGLAMNAHGANNITRDVDLAYTPESDNLERLAAFLPTIHARVSGRPAGDGFIITAQTLQRARFLNLYTELGEVDVMREIGGVDSFEGLRKTLMIRRAFSSLSLKDALELVPAQKTFEWRIEADERPPTDILLANLQRFKSFSLTGLEAAK